MSGPLIPLARVAFREAVQLPGATQRDKDGNIQTIAYPRSDDTVLAVQLQLAPSLMRRDRYNLFLDMKLGAIVIEHTQSKEQERYPLSSAKQYRLLDDAIAKKPEQAA